MSEQNREELLKKWAELAPGECNLQKKCNGATWVRMGAIERPSSCSLEWVDNGKFRAGLLSALIDAIRARGWHCKLESDEPGLENENESYAYWYVATVQWRYNMAKSEPFRELRSDETAEPCDALLAAYCAALQVLEARSHGEAMTPTEIVRILNENNHDGECDWSYFALDGERTYWSKNQRLKRDYTYNLSELSAEIIARHYLQRGVLAEQDARIGQREENHG